MPTLPYGLYCEKIAIYIDLDTSLGSDGILHYGLYLGELL